MRQEFLAKLYFARRLEPTTSATLIDKQRDICADWLASLQNQADMLATERPFEWLVYQFRIGQIEAMIHWLDVCEQAPAAVWEHAA